MVDRDSPVAVAIVLATLGALWLVLRAVTVWAAPPSTGPRRRLPMFTSPEAAADAGSGDGSAHGHGSADHAGDGGGRGEDAGGDGDDGH